MALKTHKLQITAALFAAVLLLGGTGCQNTPSGQSSSLPDVPSSSSASAPRAGLEEKPGRKGGRALNSPATKEDLIGSWESKSGNDTYFSLIHLRFKEDGTMDFLWKHHVAYYGLIQQGTYILENGYIAYTMRDFASKESEKGEIQVNKSKNGELTVQWLSGGFSGQNVHPLHRVADDVIPDYFAMYPDENPYPGTVTMGGSAPITLEVFSLNPSYYPGKIVLSAEDQLRVTQETAALINGYTSGDPPMYVGNLDPPDWDAVFLPHQTLTPQEAKFSSVGMEFEGPLGQAFRITVTLKSGWILECAADVTCIDESTRTYGLVEYRSVGPLYLYSPDGLTYPLWWP